MQITSVERHLNCVPRSIIFENNRTFLRCVILGMDIGKTPEGKPVNNTGFGFLTSSVLLVASALCLLAAITQQAPIENKGLRAVELRSIDLSSEIDSVQERKLRLRLLKLEPGGVVGMHSHKDRPTVLHVIKGTLTSHLQGKPEVREPLAQRGAAARVSWFRCSTAARSR